MTDSIPGLIIVLGLAASLGLNLGLIGRVRELMDTVEGLEADLNSAIDVAYTRGGTVWVKLNYPEHYARWNA